MRGHPLKAWTKTCMRCKRYFTATGRTSKVCPDCVVTYAKRKIKRINTNIPYKECSECKKPIRYFNMSGVCSNCQNKRNYIRKLKGKFKRKKKNGIGN